MLKEKYLKEVVPLLQKKLDTNNIMNTPKLEKVVLNM
jgi:ribosomal protein L5